jgi:hypothetical protein
MQFAHHVASVGKCELDESGKYPVNENDEKNFVRLDLHPHRLVLSGEFQCTVWCGKYFRTICSRRVSWIAWSPTVSQTTTATGTRRDIIVLAGLVPATYVFTSTHVQKRGCPGRLARRRASRVCPGMAPSLMLTARKLRLTGDCLAERCLRGGETRDRHAVGRA